MVAAMIPTCQQCGSLLSQLFNYDIINTSTSSSTTFLLLSSLVVVVGYE